MGSADIGAQEVHMTKKEPNQSPDNSDIVPPIEHVVSEWGSLDQEDFSRLDTR
jgi:hypothetical protein